MALAKVERKRPGKVGGYQGSAPNGPVKVPEGPAADVNPPTSADLVRRFASVCGWSLHEAAALMVLKGLLTKEEAEEAVRW